MERGLGKNDDVDFTVKKWYLFFCLLNEVKKDMCEGDFDSKLFVLLHCDPSDCICFIFAIILRSSLK